MFPLLTYSFAFITFSFSLSTSLRANQLSYRLMRHALFFSSVFWCLTKLVILCMLDALVPFLVMLFRKHYHWKTISILTQSNVIKLNTGYYDNTYIALKLSLCLSLLLSCSLSAYISI